MVVCLIGLGYGQAIKVWLTDGTSHKFGNNMLKVINKAEKRSPKRVYPH